MCPYCLGDAFEWTCVVHVDACVAALLVCPLGRSHVFVLPQAWEQQRPETTILVRRRHHHEHREDIGDRCGHVRRDTPVHPVRPGHGQDSDAVTASRRTGSARPRQTTEPGDFRPRDQLHCSPERHRVWSLHHFRLPYRRPNFRLLYRHDCRAGPTGKSDIRPGAGNGEPDRRRRSHDAGHQQIHGRRCGGRRASFGVQEQSAAHCSPREADPTDTVSGQPSDRKRRRRRWWPGRWQQQRSEHNCRRRSVPRGQWVGTV